VPKEITRLTGITDADLEGAKNVRELLESFLEFIGQSPVLGQNIPFDLGFIRLEIKRIKGINKPAFPTIPIFDTQTISRSFFPTLSSFGLASLCRTCGIKLTDHHRAVHDARATGELFLKLLASARRTPAGELQEMYRLLGGAITPLGELFEGLISIGPGKKNICKLDALPENRIGRWDGQAENEIAEAIDQNNIDAFFADKGPLNKAIKEFQRRDGQVAMANEVFNIFNDGGSLLAEAGTGTGKSFAYLLPALLHSRGGGSQVVISTHTRHLQEQLFQKDLPALSKALGGGFRAVLLKGRGNYICKRRFDNLTSDPDLLSHEEKIALLPLVRWLNTTKTGDISEATGFRRNDVKGLWANITAESGFCTRRVCQSSEFCFLNRIRSSTQSAHIVLVNHALLFSDLSAGGGVLGDYSKVVFDEAHHIEKVAASHLGIEFNSASLRIILNRLYDPKSERGLLSRLRKIASSVLLSPIERGSSAEEPVDEAIDAVLETISGNDQFGNELDDLLKPGFSEKQREYSQRVRYRNGLEEFSVISVSKADLEHSLQKLDKKLEKLIKEMEEVELSLGAGDDLQGELKRIWIDIKDELFKFVVLTGKENEDIVFWYEIPSNPKFSVRLYGSPLNIGEKLNKSLYSRLTSAVFTSATLTVGENFEYIAGRLGLKEYSSTIYDSPFNTQAQLYLAAATFLGNPKYDPERYTKMVARLSFRLASELDLGSLTLFTSQRMQRDAYNFIKQDFERVDRLLLGQKIDGSRLNILEQFKRNRGSALFGLDSFWEGVDVPGEALELLIIAKLPFDVPTDPLVQARSEKIEKEGGNAFIDYSLPEVALKLRQGIGRLIRTVNDTGVAVICDPRLVKSRWGKIILDSLPIQVTEYTDFDELMKNLKSFTGVK